jgi:hypothetical protein
MPKSEALGEFKKLVNEVMKRKSVAQTPLSVELKKRKRSRSRSSLKTSVKTSVRTSVRSVKRRKRNPRKSQKQQAGAVRDGSHQRFPRCR